MPGQCPLIGRPDEPQLLAPPFHFIAGLPAFFPLIQIR
jgi:hypothetical protein